MSFVEFIGFIITLVALFFLSLKRSGERKEFPETSQAELKQEREQLREILRAMDLELEEDDIEDEEEIVKEKPKATVPVVPKSKPKVVVEDKLGGVLSNAYFQPVESHQAIKVAHGEAYHLIEAKSSIAQTLLAGVSDKRDAIILGEIIGPPKALK